ncbi:hypothetical protein ACEUZ9_000859 [Paracoccus litorisediminis]|uniref:hypothetical protein n=1 Tax=Paracoccus litorisediminis TaxID=2006130 RepID=UPI0037318A4A
MSHFRQPEDLRDYQNRVASWVENCFGGAVLMDRQERARRLLEEAIEFAQAAGLSAAEAHYLVDDVHAREAGDLGQEAGGVITTLAAACFGTGLDLHQEAMRELARIERPEIIEKCRRKQAEKAERGVAMRGRENGAA